jgi:hypothetical protein
LSADDLAAEQEYLREKRKLHNRFLCGSGVVSGLEVKVGTAAMPRARTGSSRQRGGC